jgi:hypothetical protein
VATYKIAGDGRPYLIHGYPVLDKRGQDDFRFSTYQVNRGAERLFEQAGFEDGDKVSEATFYALLLDGDLYNDARPDGIEISSVPDKILAFAEQEIRPIQKDLTIFARALYLLNVFEMLSLNSRMFWMRYLLHRGCAFSGTGIATLQNLLKRGSRDKEMGTAWFFNRYKASLDIFWLRGESL